MKHRDIRPWTGSDHSASVTTVRIRSTEEAQMGKRGARTLIIGTGIAAPLLLGISPAVAANPNYFTTPAAGPAGGHSGGNPGVVCTYQAPPASGEQAPGSSAAGGSPGYTLNQCVVTGAP